MDSRRQRDKDLIITSGGKNLSAANIKTALRSASDLLGPVAAVETVDP